MHSDLIFSPGLEYCNPAIGSALWVRIVPGEDMAPRAVRQITLRRTTQGPKQGALGISVNEHNIVIEIADGTAAAEDNELTVGEADTHLPLSLCCAASPRNAAICESFLERGGLPLRITPLCHFARLSLGHDAAIAVSSRTAPDTRAIHAQATGSLQWKGTCSTQHR